MTFEVKDHTMKVYGRLVKLHALSTSTREMRMISLILWLLYPPENSPRYQ
jgi:hypothetical protein